jgi:hypothetical protein
MVDRRGVLILDARALSFFRVRVSSLVASSDYTDTLITTYKHMRIYFLS